MLWIIAVAFLLLWGFGLGTSFTLGGWIHVLLVLAALALIVRLMSGRPRHPRHGGHPT